MGLESGFRGEVAVGGLEEMTGLADGQAGR